MKTRSQTHFELRQEVRFLQDQCESYAVANAVLLRQVDALEKRLKHNESIIEHMEYSIICPICLSVPSERTLVTYMCGHSICKTCDDKDEKRECAFCKADKCKTIDIYALKYVVDVARNAKNWDERRNGVYVNRLTNFETREPPSERDVDARIIGAEI